VTGHSFAPDTLVLSGDGSTVAIADVRVGDTVAATDPETGETFVRHVTVLHAHEDANLADITVITSNGNVTLATTDTHPFWENTSQRWINAGDLKPGNALQNDAGEPVVVQEVRRNPGHRVMYDLTVDFTHTYYVIAGTTPVLVHNCGTTTLIGKAADIAAHVARNPGVAFNVLNRVGTMARGTKGTGRWWWRFNKKRFLGDAIDRGDDILAVSNPSVVRYAGGGRFADEVRHMRKRGFDFMSIGANVWRAHRR
jgi:hypothetical protein